MGRFVKGDIVVMPFPFSDLSASKRRPALVLAELKGNDVILCQITSQNIYDDMSVTINPADIENGSLNNISNARPNKLFTADSNIILYKIGNLNKNKLKKIMGKTVSMFSMITIRKTEESDINLIISCLENNSDIFISQCGYGPGRFFTSPITKEQISEFQKSRSECSLFFTILNYDIIIGSVELIINKDEEKCSIARFLIYDDYRFKGYGTQFLKIITEYVFAGLNFKKITLGVFDFNESALKCYKKAGFFEVNRIKMETVGAQEHKDWIRIDMELIK